jgi:hypothetical protein
LLIQSVLWRIRFILWSTRRKMSENSLSFIKNVIYDLKRDYGGPVDIYQNIVGQTNYKTGEQSITKNHWVVRRAIRLPRNIHRDSLFSATGNTLFAYGNVVELADRNIIIDWKDLPVGFNFKEENWYVIIDNMHYDLVKVMEFDNKAAIFVILKQLIGAPREAIVEIGVQTNVTSTQTTDEAVE